MAPEVRSVVVCLKCNSVVEIVVPASAPAHFAWLTDLRACADRTGRQAGVNEIKNLYLCAALREQAEKLRRREF